jgi:A118 family predicted phage portal protein
MAFLGFFADIARRFFGKKQEQGNAQIMRDAQDVHDYFDISGENVTSMVANGLSILTFGDAQINIDADDVLRDLISREFTAAKRVVSCGLGTGMIASIPYSVNNGLGQKIYVDTITKDRFFITGSQGSDITQCVAIAGVKRIDNDIYYRLTEYAVADGAYTIKNKCVKNNAEVPLIAVPAWAGITPEITISGVDRLPIAIFKCPAGDRRPHSLIGVPITFGCNATINKIIDTLNDVETEFKRKRVKVFADRSLIRPQYDENGNLVKQDFDEDLFVKFGSSDGFTTEIFSPEFRQSAYYDKLTRHFEMLEREIGISKGILTELNTNGATATEIKRATYNTFCLVDDIRKGYVQYINDLAYSIAVLANAYGLANIQSADSYSITVDWSYAMLEDSAETFAQKTQAVSLGAESKAELRQFIHPNESAEEAAQAVAEIEAASPSLVSGLIDTGDTM